MQRHKEEAADYRYFPEPDLVPVTVSPEQVEKVRAEMGERPAEQRQRLEGQYKLTQLAAAVLVAKGRKLVGYFEAVAGHLGGDGKQAADRLSDLVYPALSERGEEIDAFPLGAAAFADFVAKTASIGQDPRRKTFARLLADNLSVADALAAEGVRTDFDEAGLRAAVAAADRGRPEDGGRLQGRQGGGGEQAQGGGDEGQQGGAERPGDAAAGGGAGEGVDWRDKRGTNLGRHVAVGHMVVRWLTGSTRHGCGPNGTAAGRACRHRLDRRLDRGAGVPEVGRTGGSGWPAPDPRGAGP